MLPEYEKIIELPHYVSPDRAHMPVSARAAQFAPFQALSGYDRVLEESARITQQRRELGEDEIAELDRRLGLLRREAADLPMVELVYFVPDEKKQGGAYRSVKGRLKRIDEYKRLIIMESGEKIPIDQLSRLELGDTLPSD